LQRTGNILDTIIEAKRRRVERARSELPLEALREAALSRRRDAAAHALRAALARTDRLNVIAEIKRASPSKGELRGELDPGAWARAYHAGGAAAISVLTEEDYFRGSLDDLRAVRAAVPVPALRKDFIFDEWQVYETAAAGADALLLIVAALDDDKLAHLLRLTEDELGLDALVEVHTRGELCRAEACGARLVGVNNRDLRTFDVNVETSAELIAARASSALFVSESGLRTHADLVRLRGHGFAGFLVGETLMRAGQPTEELRALLGGREQGADS
jgi:indole-3-glycerol phosphate synthase